MLLTELALVLVKLLVPVVCWVDPDWFDPDEEPLEVPDTPKLGV